MSLKMSSLRVVRFLPSVKCYALHNKSITQVIKSITEVYYISQDFKMVLLRNFFIFHPILMKLGEILVLMSALVSRTLHFFGLDAFTVSLYHRDKQTLFSVVYRGKIYQNKSQIRRLFFILNHIPLSAMIIQRPLDIILQYFETNNDM